MTTDAALPTESMIVVGMEAMSMLHMTKEYKAMTGCQQGAESARVCWAAMIAEMQGDQPRQDRAPSDNEILAAWADSHWITYDEDPAGVVKFARLLFERYGQSALQSEQIQAMRDRIKTLEDSLRPFSREFEAWDGVGVWDEMTLDAMYSEAPGEVSIPTFGDLRRAAEALEKP